MDEVSETAFEVIKLLNWDQTLACLIPKSMPFHESCSLSLKNPSEGFFSEVVKTTLVSLSLVIFIANSEAIYPALVRTLLIASTNSVSKHGIYQPQGESRL